MKVEMLRRMQKSADLAQRGVLMGAPARWGLARPVEGLRTGADPVAMPGCSVND